MRQGLLLFCVFVFGVLVGAMVRLPMDMAAPGDGSDAAADTQTQPTDNADTALPAKRPPTEGIVLVTGTWGMFEFWPTIVEGRPSFASELVAAFADKGIQTETFPDATYLDNKHETRIQNAQYLAEQIDALAKRVDKVHIIAHSHGGNVALQAASLCHSKIETLVCLGTPQILYDLRDANNDVHTLPVYLSPTGRANIAHLVCVVADSDQVAAKHAGLSNGLVPGQANDMIAGWEKIHGPLRPARMPNPLATLLAARPDGHHDPNLRTVINLPQADFNILLKAHTGVGLTVDAHNATHSRAVGRLLGPILRDGPLPEHLQALREHVQPAGEDEGWPDRVSPAASGALRAQFAPNASATNASVNTGDSSGTDSQP